METKKIKIEQKQLDKLLSGEIQWIKSKYSIGTGDILVCDNDKEYIIDSVERYVRLYHSDVDYFTFNFKTIDLNECAEPVYEQYNWDDFYYIKPKKLILLIKVKPIELLLLTDKKEGK